MKRKAFLIGGCNKSPDNLLPGVHADIAAWKQYLMSSYGGCWLENEIVDLSRQSKDAICSALHIDQLIDYSLVCFSGHGYLAKDQFGFSVTMAMLDDNAEMSERELNPGSPWTMMIFDCCRKGGDLEKVALANEAHTKSALCNTRTLFEDEMLKCEKGLVKVFAADVDQSADDEKSFSRVLMGMAKSKVAAHPDGILRINEAVRLADAELPLQQTPVYMGGRRLHHFPFAVTLGTCL